MVMRANVVLTITQVRVTAENIVIVRILMVRRLTNTGEL